MGSHRVGHDWSDLAAAAEAVCLQVWVFIRVITLEYLQETRIQGIWGPFSLKSSTCCLTFPATQVQSYLAAPWYSKRGLWNTLSPIQCAGGLLICITSHTTGSPDSSVVKELACNAGDPGLISGLGRSIREGIDYPLQYSWASLVAQLVKNPSGKQKTWVQSLGWEDPLEKWKSTHSSILVWRIPWIGHRVTESDTTERLSLHFTHFREKAHTVCCSRDITLPTNVHLVKAMVFPVVMYGCESWTIKKAERQRIDAFERWCWRRLLRIPRTPRRSNQPILK